MGLIMRLGGVYETRGDSRNSRKHNASDGYAAAIWLVVVRKVCEQDAYRQYRVKHQQPRTWGMARVLWLNDIR